MNVIAKKSWHMEGKLVLWAQCPIIITVANLEHVNKNIFEIP
jgi:hypothetical protein